MELTLISSFYSLEPFMPAIRSYPASRIILVIDAKKDDPELKKNLDLVNGTFGQIAKIETVFVDSADVLGTVKVIAKLIDKETADGRKIVMNASGGFKLLGHGLLYASFARPSKVEKIVCSTMKDARLVELPKLSFDLSEPKLKLLRELEKKEGRSVDELAKQLKKSRAMVYQHLKELKNMGYINEKFEITNAGRMALT